MSCLNKYIWELRPNNLPIVRKKCPKCNEKSHYINTERFRVNANKNSIDVWLIYQCEKCKSTWNMAIYERVKPYDINKIEYEKFLSNDKELAREYAFNLSVFNKNKAEIDFDNVNYELIQKSIDTYDTNENELVFKIVCKYPIDLRVDKLLSDSLSVPRAQIKNMYKKGTIFIQNDRKSLNTRIRDGMEIVCRNVSHLQRASYNIVY